MTPRRAALLLAAGLTLWLSAPLAHAVQRITISADSIEAPAFRVTKGVAQMRLDAQAFVGVEADSIQFTALPSPIASPALSCSALSVSAGSVECKNGTLAAEQSRFPFLFSFDTRTSRFALTSQLDAGERWTVEGIARGEWQVDAAIAKGQLKRFAGWLPEGEPRPTAGTLDATIHASGKGGGALSARIDAKLQGAAFGDAAGLKAGEKLDLALSASMARNTADGPLQWSLAADYLAGEIFWQPIYVAKGGHRVTAEGSWADGVLSVKSGNLALAGIGSAAFDGAVTTAPLALTSANVKTSTLAVAPLFDTFVKPMLGQSMLGEAVAQGSIEANAAVRNGALAQAQLSITNVSLTDPRGRFAVNRLNAVVPWERGKTTSTRVVFDSALALDIPIGRVSFPLSLGENGLNVRRIALPVLDGSLEVRNFDLERVGEGEQATWTWRLDGRIAPISMEALTAALKLPVMKGSLAGEIPNVAYARETLAVNGDIAIDVFGGKMIGRNIVLLEPFGRAPRFLGDFTARNLDLDLLTSTFSFGRMQGRIDADVKLLELADWKPVTFDASVRSSPGDYRKRISQQAVQNISALGGGGAAAAIQRSFLRVFEEFGYDRLGLTCKLNNGICAMGGVEEAAQGYVIVKGGGIPSLTVLGYNRNVSWETLLARVQGIVAGNVKPTIQ